MREEVFVVVVSLKKRDGGELGEKIFEVYGV